MRFVDQKLFCHMIQKNRINFINRAAFRSNPKPKKTDLMVKMSYTKQGGRKAACMVPSFRMSAAVLVLLANL